MDLSQFITKTGMQRLQKRINELLAERPEVIKAVAIAREFGDLSENAEYKAARERQRAIDNEI
ncbi:MAG: transcription elongation factor GreA, partial [Candidatus Cloacimonetes bacterium]|nr:transcription elongation factor GreA [Candidatus Cloacimonadota bacterium]